MKITFEVGQAEKHKVEFSWGGFWGMMRIEVDGTKIASSGITLASPYVYDGTLPFPDEDKWKLGKEPWGTMEILLVKRWAFMVGEQEQHEILIEKRRERWLAGFRPSHYRVFVDGQCVKECQGY